MNGSPLRVTTPAGWPVWGDDSGLFDRNALIESHVDLVGAVSRQVAGGFPRHVDRDELVRAGTIGLVEAADRYNASLGVPFRSFAAQRIRGAMLDSLRAHDWAPRSVRTAARRLDEAEHDLTNRLRRSPTTQEVAAEVGMTAVEVSTVRHGEVRAMLLTLDALAEDGAPDGGAGPVALADVLVDLTAADPAERLEDAEMHSYVQDAVALLPPRHRRVIEGYFFADEPSDAIAATLAVSVSRVSQLKTEALGMLRDGLLAQFRGTTAGADGTGAATPPCGTARAERRRAAYAEAIAAHRDWRSRVA